MSEIWHRVVLPYAVFAVVTRDDLVVEAAPIGRWMVGKSLETVRRWVTGKGGSVTELP